MSPPEFPIPGPQRSFLRMAGISQKADPEEAVPLLARNIYVQGYVGWQDQGRPTEFLVLLGRYVNQAEEYQVREMEERDGVYRLEIPGAYTQSPFSLQYFFEVHQGPNHAWLLPGFDPNRPAQPYFAVKQA